MCISSGEEGNGVVVWLENRQLTVSAIMVGIRCAGTGEN